jgi:hypothetical protein
VGIPRVIRGLTPGPSGQTACNRCCSTVCFVTPVTTSVQDLGQDVTGLPTSRPGRAGAPGDPHRTAGRPGVWVMAARPAFGSFVPQDGCWVAGRSRNAGRWHGIDDMADLHVSRWRLTPAETGGRKFTYGATDSPAPGASIQPERAYVRGMHRYRRCVTVHDADSCFEGDCCTRFSRTSRLPKFHHIEKVEKD